MVPVKSAKSIFDQVIIGFDHALRVSSGLAHASRPTPQGAPAAAKPLPPGADARAATGVAAEADAAVDAKAPPYKAPMAGAGVDALPAADMPPVAAPTLSEAERRRAAGLMRVNHVGEVCAQALYQAQARFAKSRTLRSQFEAAGREEEDHLAWTMERLQDLGAQPSLLNPLWYAGSYALGALAAQLGDAKSLGFVVETERQVEAHLASHLQQQGLPPQDAKSRAIVAQMRVDEVAHGAAAKSMGAQEPPPLAQKAMALMGRLMTRTAYYL